MDCCLKNKFCLLMWKNYILQARHPVQTFFEIFLPLVFTGILLFFRDNFSPRYDPYLESSTYEFTPDDKGISNFGTRTYSIIYAPNSPDVESIINAADLTSWSRGYTDEATLIENYKRGETNEVGAAVIFKNGVSNNEISYEIRLPAKTGYQETKWYTNLLYEDFPLNRPTILSPGYEESGFLFIQWSIDKAIIKSWAQDPGALSDFNMVLSPFPYPNDVDDSRFVTFVAPVIPWFLMLSYMYSVANITRSIVQEREQRLRESMKMMGLPGWLHWSAWLAKSYILLGISAIFMTVMYKWTWENRSGGYGYGGYGQGRPKPKSFKVAIFGLADGSVLFVFLLAYTFALITFGFFLASLFSKANSSATGAGFIHMLSFFPYALSPSYMGVSRGQKLWSSLLCNSAMGFGFQIISRFEGAGVGIKWSNIGTPVTADDTISLLTILGMLILDGFLYLLLTVYIEAVFPGEFGTRSPWYFPIMPSYWCDGGSLGKSTKVQPVAESHLPSDYFEKEPVDANVGIKIMGLRKVFGRTVAVNNLELNFYEDQVTALLGHNGAGKTTTMSMITGLYRPTSGTALVNGFDIRTEIGKVHKSLGLCPQHNVLFDELTVGEHLKFFCLLKGFNGNVEAEMDRMLTALQLWDKKWHRSTTLSGGMKRKLSVGIALIGGSRVVLLDEPTAGMDPGARRSIWDLITSEKQGKTILLSTHFMDEADLLGDRIAILANGKAVCCGSSLFLKQKYGGGYHLVMVKEPNCQVNRITELIQKHMPEVNVDQNIGTELSYSLPDSKVTLFSTLFGELEKRKGELGVSSYGCSNTQMEEVFIRAGEQVDKEAKQLPQTLQSAHTIESQPRAPVPEASQSKSKVSSKQEINLDVVEVEAPDSQFDDNPPSPPTRNRGSALLVQQLRAMLVKKWQYAMGSKFTLIVNALLPILFLTWILYELGDSSPGESRKVKLALDLSKYGNPITTMECSPRQKICDDYRDVATTKMQSIVVDVGNTEGYILNKYADNVWKTNSRYIVGLQVTIDNGRTSTTLQDTNQTGADLNVTNPKHKREVTANATESQAKNNTGTVGSAPTATKLKLKGFYNRQPYHAAPVALNFISQSILRTLSGNKGMKLSVSNYPLPLTHDQVESLPKSGSRDYLGFLFIPLVVSFTMVFVAATFIILPIKERASKSKHLQFVSGVPAPIFWLGHLIFDGVYYLVISVSMTLVLAVFQTPPLDSANAFLKFFLLLIFYGWAVIPMSYLSSFRYSSPSSGYVKMVFFYWTTTIVASILNIFCIVLELDDPKNVGPVCLIWKAPFRLLVPGMDLMVGILTVMLDEMERRVPGWGRESRQRGIFPYLLYPFIHGLFCYGLVYFAESGVLCSVAEGTAGMFRRGRGPGWDPMTLEDSDVLAESDRVRSTHLGQLFMTDTMVLKDLTKYYGNFLAVDKLCLGVKHGECFGLLGVNGAGKTTTFMMLTGDETTSEGDAYISGKSVTRQRDEVRQVIGYCPQFDALIPELTGAETIRLFARLRGVRESLINGLIEYLGADLLLTEHMQKPCGSYSGGNKRKLSTAIALIGNPAVIFLDEPTAGLDPVARRHLWNAVIKVRETGTSVILTSHSMDECEALCTRLAIMVNGRFRCLGSTQHLKNKFGDGYTIIAQLPPSPEEQPKRTRTSLETGRRRESLNAPPEAWELHLQPLRHFIETTFPDCLLKDMHPCYVHYHIPMNGPTSWSQMFKKMEEAKALYQLEAYSVGQTSLEQVFLGFARGQFNEEN